MRFSTLSLSLCVALTPTRRILDICAYSIHMHIHSIVLTYKLS